jgi:hypothetical protein
MENVHTPANAERSPDSKKEEHDGGPPTAPKEPERRAPERRWKMSPELTIGVATVIIGIAAMLIAHWDFDRLHELLSRAGKVDFNDEAITLDRKVYQPPKGPLRVQFWTPSVHTKEAAGTKEWERLDNDDKLNAFGDELMTRKIVAGYRRYEVTGSGLGGRKIGAWWVATGEFKFIEFIKLYQTIWKPGEDDIYMEIAPVSAGHSR